MASTTPNIGLTLPTGAEKVSRQIINDNNTKIDTAIGTLNSKIDEKLDYYTLLNGETVTSTLTNKTLFGGRSLSNYKLLLAVVKRGGVLRVSLITAQGLFDYNTAVMSLTEVDSTNTQRWYEIKYVNDTTVSIQCSSNASGNADIYLYGLH